MEKKASLLILLLASSVCASNDARLTMRNWGTGVCLSVDSITDQACENQTLVLDGTADHFVYFVPETPVTPRNTTGQQVGYFVSVFPDTVYSNIFAFLMLGFTLAVVYIWKKLAF